MTDKFNYICYNQQCTVEAMLDSGSTISLLRQDIVASVAGNNKFLQTLRATRE